MDFPFLLILVLLTVKPGLHTELKVFLSCVNVPSSFIGIVSKKVIVHTDLVVK